MPEHLPIISHPPSPLSHPHVYSLYPSCNWEDKAIRKLVGDGKLAARLRGTENRTSPTDRECPICFLQYKEVNTTKCCSAYICTECYLQVRPQKAKSYSCPFCNHNKMSVTVAQQMNAEAMLAREETEQRFIEAKIRERAEAQQRAEAAETEANNNAVAAAAGFGSSLQQDERIATLRARSSSLSDQENAEAMIPEDVLRESFAMTPEERRMLEDEMRSQNSHPLSLRLEAEAQERRLRNEQEFMRQNPAHAMQLEAAARARSSNSRRSGRGSERRNWNQIVEAFERGGHGEVNSLDDLVVLEAAMILSMEEESRRRTGQTNNNNNNNSTAAAAAGGGAPNFDPNRHAGDGFPLVRSILSGRQEGNAEQNEQLQSLANNLYRRRSRNSLMRAYGGGPGGAPGGGGGGGAAAANGVAASMDTAGLLMRGISEEDQMAMAIAASLQDQQQEETTQQQNQEGEEGSSSEANSGSASASASASASGEATPSEANSTSGGAEEESAVAAAATTTLEEDSAVGATLEEAGEGQTEAAAAVATEEEAQREDAEEEVFETPAETEEAAAEVAEATTSAPAEVEQVESSSATVPVEQAPIVRTDALDEENHGGEGCLN